MLRIREVVPAARDGARRGGELPSFRVLHNDRIHVGSAFFAKGQYLLYIPACSAITCRRSSVLRFAAVVSQIPGRFAVSASKHRGTEHPMAAPNVKSLPKPGEVWLSCPPYLMLARIVAVDFEGEPPVVSYELYDDDGSVLQGVEHATLDRGWWRAFQPLQPRYG